MKRKVVQSSTPSVSEAYDPRRRMTAVWPPSAGRALQAPCNTNSWPGASSAQQGSATAQLPSRKAQRPTFGDTASVAVRTTTVIFWCVALARSTTPDNRHEWLVARPRTLLLLRWKSSQIFPMSAQLDQLGGYTYRLRPTLARMRPMFALAPHRPIRRFLSARLLLCGNSNVACFPAQITSDPICAIPSCFCRNLHRRSCDEAGFSCELL